MQILSFVLLSIMSLAFAVLVRPRITKMLNILEMVNEIFMLIYAYYLFLFTEYVSDPALRSQIGSYLLYLVLFNIMINFVTIFYSQVIEIKAFIIRFIKKRRQTKNLMPIPLPLQTPPQSAETITTHRGERMPINELFEEEEKQPELRQINKNK